MNKQLSILISLVMSCMAAFAQQATWIYYPGDFEIWLGNEMQNRRTERGAFFPPFWKMDSHYVLIEFSKEIDLQQAEEVEISVEGKYNVKLDGKLMGYNPRKITVPAGKHSLNIKVYNQATVPSIFVKGRTVKSDNSWLVTFEDKEWIDESGKASDISSGTTYMNASSWNFNSEETPPSKFKLALTPIQVVKTEIKNNGILVDFGKETFGYARLHNLKGKGCLNIYYGESLEEALDTNYCETLDSYIVDNSMPADFIVSGSKAYRYIYIEKDAEITFDNKYPVTSPTFHHPFRIPTRQTKLHQALHTWIKLFDKFSVSCILKIVIYAYKPIKCIIHNVVYMACYRIFASKV
ncbi:hypothetical protein EZS27_007036 [termite gut metagenome]|uniref:Alpha-rhamnosidase-like N-terminal domain-containing protein n=1 Tax=termite gut metagenome TaxID=433724 RepID=A0A5J4SJJ8_9ZZZZ